MPFQFRKEAIEEDLNRNFPSQGQGNPPLYYSLSEVVVPTYSINTTAEGSGLPENLQTAWDFSTDRQIAQGSTVALITNPGFWIVSWNAEMLPGGGAADVARLQMTDGVSTKTIIEVHAQTSTATQQSIYYGNTTVFLRSGDTLQITTNQPSATIVATTRQIADLNGNLVNPLGFSFA